MSANQSFSFEAIGTLKSCFTEKFGTPRQPHLVPHSRASLSLRNDLQPEQILSGLEKVSHVWLFSVFHENKPRNKNKPFLTKVHPPRLAGASIGVYATRSPHRPNPIGLTLARLLKIEGPTLFFSEIDLVDGTPILDIKPYVPEIDQRAFAQAGWVDDAKPVQIPVRWSLQAAAQLEKLTYALPAETNLLEFQSLVSEVLTQDPRPPLYKTEPFLNPNNPRSVLGMALYQLNILFTFSADGFDVLDVEPLDTCRKTMAKDL